MNILDVVFPTLFLTVPVVVFVVSHLLLKCVCSLAAWQILRSKRKR